jgi:divinyl chlorophyllide a 8-vinyl-reductase
LVLGATGTIGRAVVGALVARGHEVICFVRQGSALNLPGKAIVRMGDVCDPACVDANGFRGEVFDAVVSCIASRNGLPQDAWAVDYGANLTWLNAARAAGVRRFVLLSAICVQRPRLAFQHAKLAFEAQLITSGLDYSIVRPTAFFKSLSGQVERVRAGKPFLLFGDGQLTACKPISDRDLACYVADCLTHEDRRNRILPIGGPGPAITPREQGEALFRLLGRTPRFRSAPLWLMDGIIRGLDLAARALPNMATKAELARIGRYYASESMLLLNPATGRYDADATPSTGADTLFEHYAALLQGTATVERGAHSVF